MNEQKNDISAKQVAERFNIEPMVCVDIKNPDDISLKVKAYAEKLLTKIVQEALGSEKFTVKIEINEIL